MHHYQGYASAYPTHAEIPNAPANAEATAMITFKMIPHVLFLFSGSLFMFICFLVILQLNPTTSGFCVAAYSSF